MSEFEQDYRPDYKTFTSLVEGRIQDDLPLDLETVASPQEIGWWKQFQFRRALRHLRMGISTPVEQRYLKNKGNINPSGAAKERIEGKE